MGGSNEAGIDPTRRQRAENEMRDWEQNSI